MSQSDGGMIKSVLFSPPNAIFMAKKHIIKHNLIQAFGLLSVFIHVSWKG